ncbi:hypothetical protein GGI35DRAFT_464316 [Trichoderma velutinum]
MTLGSSSEVNSVAVNKTISYSISYCLHGIKIPCSASPTGNRVIQCKVVQISYKFYNAAKTGDVTVLNS